MQISFSEQKKAHVKRQTEHQGETALQGRLRASLQEEAEPGLPGWALRLLLFGPQLPCVPKGRLDDF